MREQLNCGPAGRHFDKRVRILATVINQPDEIALASEMLQRDGCLVRRADEDGAPILNECKTTLVIDMWLSGSRRFAVQGAVKRVEELAEGAKLALWVTDAALVDNHRDDRKTYCVYSKVPRRSGWKAAPDAMQAWINLKGTRRLIQVPEGTPEKEVQAELDRRDLGQPFDSALHSFRSEPAGVGMPVGSLSRRFWIIVCLVAAMVCGAATLWTNSVWRLLPLMGIVVAAVLVALCLEKARHGFVRRFGWGLLYSVLFAALGAISAARPGGVLGPLGWLGTGILAVIGFFIGWGVVLGARGQWFARNAAWAVPLAFALLAPTVVWLGGIIYSEYLIQFGIPDSSVSIPTTWKVLAAAGPLLFGASFGLLFIALFGWLRYFHTAERLDRPTLSIFAALILLTLATTTLRIGVTSATTAAGRAMTAAQHGHTPVDYFGMQGSFICLQTLNSSVPVLFGPLPNQPLLFFGASGERLWAWDPGSAAVHYDNAHVISVPLQDVTVVQATGQPPRCP